ncbi:uncharacterized protein LOC117793494 [Drosophila innubila]|uniref:uncharacterized protein LOC117793494 n=1 Tax=Drosophila innubila TaxID=198719 RepID=UPI00148CF1C9|nr:uncharacterized protein LOC117793494 [Drosophila innubila]
MSKCQQQQQQQQFFEFESEHEDQGKEKYDPLENLLSLQLRKPAHWNLELNTSRSCSNIALPRILLYDHKGVLILEADGQEEQTYRPTTVSNRRKLFTSSNLTHISHEVRLANEFHDLCIGEATPSSKLTPIQQLTESCIDFSTHELPDWQAHDAISSRRSSSLRGVRFKDKEQRQKHSQQRLLDYPTPPSTSTMTMTANSSSSGPQEKRRYRRTQSYGQHSILERISMSRGRFSSPEYATEQTLEHAPQYFLRTSKAGTLVIKDESFNRGRQRRRRYRDSSSENVLIHQERSPSESGAQVSARQHLLQRGREQLYSTSEDEAQVRITTQSRSRRNQRHCCKDVTTAKLMTVDPGNCVYRASIGAIAR